MYNRNYGGFDYVRIHSELLKSVFNLKIIANLAVTDGYTRPLAVTIMKLPQKIINFIEEKTEMTNMVLPWNYPSIDKFNDFQAGYRFNAKTLENLTGKKGEFDENWFVVCSNYFDDPFFINISEAESDYPIYYAQHGAGSWKQIKISENITEFSNQLKEIKKLENNKDLLLDKLKNEFDLENELWNEVYESTLEDE